jgi:UDP-glucose 4-epimerase
MHAVGDKGKGTYHISSGSDVSIKELFDATTTALNMKIAVEVKPRQPDDVYSILLDPSRTTAEFGWNAKVPLAEGVRRTVHYYVDYGIEETFTHLKEVSKNG